METRIPPTSSVMRTLIRADLTTLSRNRRSAILVLLVPVIILISWKGLIDKLGGAFALSSAITLGLIAIGLMGYSNSIARDRGQGHIPAITGSPCSFLGNHG